MAYNKTTAPVQLDKQKFQNQKSPAELREWLINKEQENYDKAVAAFKKLNDVEKNSQKTIRNFDKDRARRYLKNLGSNQVNLRDLSRYLYYRSPIYYKIVMYYATMFCLDARSVIPPYSIHGDNDSDKILSSYAKTLAVLDKLNLSGEFLKAFVSCVREDVFFGCLYYNDKSKSRQASFILPLDPDYCKIAGMYDEGDYAFAFDMSYFNRKKELLEYWGSPFEEMYEYYQEDRTNHRWVYMPPEYSVCLKFRTDDSTTVIPPFSGLLISLINLLDLEDIQALADEAAIQKLIYLPMPTIKGSQMIDDWAIDTDLLAKYYNRLADQLPSYIAVAMVPGEKLGEVSFPTDATSDTNKVLESEKTILNASGGAQVLNSASVSGSTAIKAALEADSQFVIKPLLPQVQSWINRFVSYKVPHPAKVKFYPVSAYTRADFRKELIESAQHGLPTKLAVSALSGFSELDTLALNHLEESILNLTDIFRPLKSSYTTSGNTEKDISELSDEGEATRDQDKNDM